MSEDLSTESLALLDALEAEQAKLICWGVPDGTFTYEEVEEQARKVLNDHGKGADEAAVWGIVKPLLETCWLWTIPETEPPLYRTRVSEAVRLFVQLRQMFPGKSADAWRGAPRLVADYRMLLRKRVFPGRTIDPDAAVKALLDTFTNTTIGTLVTETLLRKGGGKKERKLGGFQLRASQRILKALQGNKRTSGTIVCAGTGSGKTLAFYLPALVAIASMKDQEHWTKCLALYPRNELLKDQFREALGNLFVINPELRKRKRPGITVGALFGDTPSNFRQVKSKENGWTHAARSAKSGYLCPLARCPLCASDLIWPAKDLDQQREILVCSASGCAFEVGSDGVMLTRERMLANPPDVLFTTTEMLNQRLGSTRYRRLLGIGQPEGLRPRLLLLDEVHTNEGIHGAHVAMLIRRWRQRSGASPHIVGLSATLEDAQRFFAELIGIAPSSVVEVSPTHEETESQGHEYQLALRSDPSSAVSVLSTSIQSLMLLRRVLGARRGDSLAGNRVFAFTDNLDVINRLFPDTCDAEGMTRWGKPKNNGAALASLRRSELAGWQQRFDEGQSWDLVEDIGHNLDRPTTVVARTSSQDPGVQAGADIVIATAALEVGFDDPHVGAVLQHKAPRSAAGFLQRKGRAGRQRGMRPWTVIVLSDYGRDRSAYQAYEHTFSPTLAPRHLPLRNRAMLRMQATYALFDYLGTKVTGAEPWQDLAAPTSEKTVKERQTRYTEVLRELLVDEGKQQEFSQFIARALGLDLARDGATLEALLWHPPRPVLMGAVPTLLRRLEQSWTVAFSSDKIESHFRYGPPVPEFVQKTLFGDLLVPEVQILIGGEPPSMLIAHAIREFSPGRISFRFDLTDGGGHWVHPGEDDAFNLDRCCPEQDREYLGEFAYSSAEGPESVQVFRPRSITVTRPPEEFRASSNAFPRWKAQIVAPSSYVNADLPSGSPWQEILREVRFHMHRTGNPIEMRRFSPGCRATLMRQQETKAEERDLAYVSGPDLVPSALGFVADVDAIRIQFAYPKMLLSRAATDGELLRGLRPARFRDRVRDDDRLDGLINRFQRDRLSEAYLASLTELALSKGITLQEAAQLLAARASLLTESLQGMFQWAPPGGGGDEDSDASDGSAGGQPKRLAELLDALQDKVVVASLHKAAEVLWQPLDAGWETWVKARYKATLAAGILEAFASLCPQIDTAVVHEDLEAYTGEPVVPGEDCFWLSEATIGGGGAIEQFFQSYTSDPRRFFRLLESALGPSDFERVAAQMQRTVELAAGPAGQPVPVALDALRRAEGHHTKLDALGGFRRALAEHGVQTDPSLVVSIHARLLVPGSGALVDSFLNDLLKRWTQAEERLGYEIDVRAWCGALRHDKGLEESLGVAPPAGGSDRVAWRYAVLRSMLWAKGWVVRAEALRVGNPFSQAALCDRLLVIETLPRRIARVTLEGEAWFEAVTAVLVAEGVVEIEVGADGSAKLAEAIRSIAERPIDTGALRVHGRIVGVRREPASWVATFELPEAFQ